MLRWLPGLLRAGVGLREWRGTQWERRGWLAEPDNQYQKKNIPRDTWAIPRKYVYGIQNLMLEIVKFGSINL